MLGAIAAVALVIGTLGATVSVSQTDKQGVEKAREPVVEVQTIENAGAADEGRGF